MNLRTISSKNAKQHFDQFLDTAQKEAIIVTKHNRPVAALISMFGANTEHPTYSSTQEIDAFISELRDEWK